MNVIRFETSTVSSRLRAVERRLMTLGASVVQSVVDQQQSLLLFEDPARLVDDTIIQAMPGVLSITYDRTKNGLVERAPAPAGFTSGIDNLTIIAGPCGIESEEQIAAIFSVLADEGLRFARAGAFKPRTSPHDYQGPGHEGLTMAADIAAEHGLQLVSEIVDPRDVAAAADHIAIVRIGTRSMQNFPLLREVGQAGLPVLLKRGMSATIAEWIGAAEHALVAGAPTVIFCERGIRTFERATRNTLDILGAVALKEQTDLPVIVDPSHAAGRRSLVAAGARSAIAAGLDGVIVEIHHDPASARSDAAQALPLQDFRALMRQLRRLALVQHEDVRESAGETGNR